ncbi:MAG: hypothetical protein J3K34DRAFT_420229 [Monoraphidium minutum]|nr:MAG: hypothetical protein J3K34DRAFT_420229 [Monoraphidium minutum]
MNRLALLAVVAVALTMPGALAQGGRKMMTLSPGKKLVNAQVKLDKRVYQAQATQVISRQQAVNKVTKTLDKAAMKEDRLDARVDAKADKAAALNAKAGATGSIFTMKRAAVAEVNVEKALRDADKEKAQLAFKVDRKVQDAVQDQARKEDRAGDRVVRAGWQLDKAELNFDRFLVRKGYAGPAPLGGTGPTPLGGAGGPGPVALGGNGGGGALPFGGGAGAGADSGEEMTPSFGPAGLFGLRPL